ncbi:hypothetical protein K504DRAFT_411488 [Pleomassaria siparia CBS 279.74]|uniref:Letm1 RBD domain-containing protein n=1 Tax=Pleomassaria siparia CBS 279.74 TaxID=1314801 RepID=A0A6G1K3B2_9PLEO|nr:hypothetical protein K504DRAFT_411488 [Pleomassaria siparia CBS 279.74]
MKPRPFALLAASAPRQNSILGFQCRHFQGSRITSLKYHQWHEQSRQPLTFHNLPSSYSKHTQYTRYASSNAAVASNPTSAPIPSGPTETKRKITASTKLTPTPKTLRPSDIAERLNPPPETYAPVLDLPERTEGQGKLKWLYHCGKAYIGFYKGGIANVRATARMAKVIRAKLAEKGKDEDLLTRAEWQIIKRSRSDMLRLPVFGLLVLLLGEWLPLIALYITPVIPEPCRIPAQTKRRLAKLEQRRQYHGDRLIRANTQWYRDNIGQAKAVHPAMGPLGSMKPSDVAQINTHMLQTISIKLDAHWTFVDILPPIILHPIFRWCVERKLAYLNKDDELIRTNGGWEGLSKEEATRACVERGIYVLGKSDKDIKKDLKAWFTKLT